MISHPAIPENCTSGRCRANGIDIHFLRTGNGKPPVVALHGLTGSGACLAPLASMLADDFRVILPDARGHGQSDAPDSGYCYCELAADVAGLTAALDLKAPVLLGHSMGGLTALVAASLIRPPVSALVLIDPTFISLERQRQAHQSGLAAEHEQLLKLSRSSLLARARQRSPHRSSVVIRHLVEARMRFSVNALAILRPPNPDYRALLRRVRVPTLLVLGENGLVPRDSAEEMRHLNPLVRLALVAGAGHGLPYDDPIGIGEISLSFLRGLGAFSDRAARGIGLP